MEQRKKPGPDKRFSERLRDIRVTAETKRQLGCRRRDTGLSISQIVRQAIERYLQGS